MSVIKRKPTISASNKNIVMILCHSLRDAQRAGCFRNSQALARSAFA
jgi:hypothetical protein